MPAKRLGRVCILLACLYLSTEGWADTNYKTGDWISYSTFRFVRGIATDQRYVYFATTGGISRYNLNIDTWADPFTTSNGLADNNVYVIAVDPVYLNLWCATREGVSRYDLGTANWTTYLSGGGRFLTDIHSIGVTDDRRLFFEGSTGVAIFDLMRNIWTTPESSGRLLSSSAGYVRWYGARERLLYNYPLFHTDLDYVFNPPESIMDKNAYAYPITSFQEDTFANVWISTWGLNIGKGSLRSLQLDMHRIGLASRNVTSMLFDGDHIWFGSASPLLDFGGFSPLQTMQESGSITRFNTVTGVWDYILPHETDGLPVGSINTMVADTSEVWIGTDNGIAVLDKSEKLWTPLPVQDLTTPDITTLGLSPTHLWIGTTTGLNRMDRHSRVIMPVPAPAILNLWIHDIAISRQETVWIATNQGVYRRSRRGKWQKIEDPDTANLNGAVFEIEMDNDDIWFGIRTALLKYDRKTGDWQTYSIPLSVEDGPLRIYVTVQSVWVGSRNGAARFEKEGNKWLVYTTQDGLINDSVQALMPDGDYMWFGTTEGVTRFYWNDPARVE